MRNNLDITAEILTIASKPVNKCRIMYGANLNFHVINRYFDNLIRNGMLRRNGNRTYERTQKGLEFLDQYNRLQRIICGRTKSFSTFGADEP